MHDFTQRGTFVNTYWKQTKAAPERDEWTLFGIGLAEYGNDVELGRGPSHADCLVQAQVKLAAEYPGRFI